MKKNNTAQKTALEVEKIQNALREGTEKTLRNLIKEALDDVISDDSEEESTEDEPVEDNSYEVQDVETSVEDGDADGDSKGASEPDGEKAPEEGEKDAPQDEIEGDDADSEWDSELDDYKVGDDEDYDLTGVDGDFALKVYNSLGDDDQIFVQKKDDGSYEVKDNETGAEFVIELEPNGGEKEPAADEFETEPDAEETEISFDDEEGEEPEEESEIELDLGNAEDEDSEDFEEDEDELNENLGYTDSYQKDVMPGLKMNEPANKKATYSMDGGVPEGNKKPWAGKHKEKDFKETHTDLAEGKCCGKECELDENQTVAKAQKRKQVKTMAPNSGESDKPEVTRETSVAGQPINEAKVRKIVEAAKAIQAENKQYQNVIGQIKKALYEAATLNMNYGKIVNLLINETTTKDEKKAIVERFSHVKTINEGKQLYDTIKAELNESTKKNAAIKLDEQISVNASNTINETTIYNGANPSLDLMRRMDNLFKDNKKINESKATPSASLNLWNRMEKLDNRKK